MIKLIVGDPGSGKTKQMIDMANSDGENSVGTIIYIDFSDKHMHQLVRQVRLISVSDLNLKTFNHIYGFICGLNCANYDIQKIYMDGLIKTIDNGYEELPAFLEKIDPISEKYDIDIIISATITDKKLIEKVKPFVIK